MMNAFTTSFKYWLLDPSGLNSHRHRVRLYSTGFEYGGTPVYVRARPRAQRWHAGEWVPMRIA